MSLHKLSLDDLAVESFVAADAPEGAGTVHGHASLDVACRPADTIKDDTCADTCDLTCGLNCPLPTPPIILTEEASCDPCYH